MSETKPDPRELARRDQMRRQQRDESFSASALIFMTQWMKRRGVPVEKVLDLTEWQPAEIQEIRRIYRYKFT